MEKQTSGLITQEDVNNSMLEAQEKFRFIIVQNLDAFMLCPKESEGMLDDGLIFIPKFSKNEELVAHAAMFLLRNEGKLNDKPYVMLNSGVSIGTFKMDYMLDYYNALIDYNCVNAFFAEKYKDQHLFISEEDMEKIMNS
jgi:hypothetical protein